ncbi:hypothetical protein QEH59_13465 [Coraliomargarita sp. SDUM461004]|uniref:PsbP C-terminal domain-containing protein n=1 Tax=Thalassobacterium sedimentorum TaxID=3041258 RepID=A0ABU1AL86_9BACT|nr:hypothetical protein [Coraliomargarita sp. SDUM461004]MDQ8195439.1 hypothetical protein [Coraliomargarita sp. SDUM461004]
MKKCILICILFPALALTLMAKSLKIADTILFKVPEDWSYLRAEKQVVPHLGVLTRAMLENPEQGQKLTVSVLLVEELDPSVQYSTELIEATLSPLVEAYRKQGSHYYPRKILGRGNFVFYSQEVGRLDARKVELRGVLMKRGDHWVNFFCQGPTEITWTQYEQLILGTRLL